MIHSFLKTLLIVFVLLFNACNSSDHSVQGGLDKKVQPCFLPFDNFPDSLFYGINWNTKLVEAQKSLSLNSFDVVDSSGGLRYFNSNDSVEVLIPNSEKITQFKVIMFSRLALQNFDELVLMLSEKSISSDKAERFKVIQHSGFKIQLVNNDNSIQINFEENKKH